MLILTLDILSMMAPSWELSKFEDNADGTTFSNDEASTLVYIFVVD